ncbi:MAG: glycosyltransferase [Desulfobacterales bacterium]|nr:glycosyltransferase [Desulfobacterales bacterium]
MSWHRINIEIIQSRLFDQEYYMRKYPDVKLSGIDPLSHFISFGWQQGRKPNPLFDTVFYQKQYTSDKPINPLFHYITIGWKKGYNPHPLFDTMYYLNSYPDVANSGLNPLTHFLFIGYKLGCRSYPPITDLSVYLQKNPNIFKLGINPHLLLITDTMQRIQDVKKIFFSNNAKPDVSIIIPVYNNWQYTQNCLKGLFLQSSSFTFEVIIINDCSTDETAEQLKSIQGIIYLCNDQNYGFLRSCNLAAKETSGKYICFLNNDTLPLPHWLDELIKPMIEDTDIGMVGSMLLYPDGRLQEAGAMIWNDGTGHNIGRLKNPNLCEYNYRREVDYCSGASIAIPIELWRQLKGFNQMFEPAYYEDTDLAFRVRKAGLKCIYNPFSKIVHFEGISSGTDVNAGVKSYQLVNQNKFFNLWQETLASHSEPQPQEYVTYKKYANHCLLWIDATIPTPDQDSGSLDCFNFLKVIVKNKWAVTFLPFNLSYCGKYTESLQRLGIECIYAPYTLSIDDYLRAKGDRFDIVVLSRVSVAEKVMNLVKRYSPRAKLVFNTVDIHFLREQREAEIKKNSDIMKQAMKTRLTELRMIRSSDMTITISKTEEELIRSMVTDAKLTTIPMIREFSEPKLIPYENRKDICFIGGFGHPPNVDAIQFFLSTIWPLVVKKIPQCHFIIAGSNIPKSILDLAGGSVIIKGFIPDLEELFNTVRLSVAPLRYGAGTKGKIVSSLSYGVPVVATNIAAEGMGLVEGKEILVADNPSDFVRQMVYLYTSESIWTQMSSFGRLYVHSTYSFSAIAPKILKMLSDLVNLKSGRE